MRAETPRTFERDPGELSTGKAFCISLLIHVLLFGIGHNLPVKPPESADRKDEVKAEDIKTVTIEFVMEDTRPEPVLQDTPLQFAMIDPSTASAEVPKDAKRYSFADSVASNPSPSIDTGQAKIDGIQDKVLQTYNAPREQPTPLQPLLGKPTPKPEQSKDQARALTPAPLQPKIRPKTKPAPKLADRKPTDGNERPKPKLTAALPPPKPIDTEKPSTPTPDPPKPKRPRTIAEANKQLANKQPGQKMKQDGGVRRRGKISIDAQGSPMGAYDARLIASIQHRWFQLIDESGVRLTQHGKVVVTFRLHADGRVSEIKATESSLGTLSSYVCQAAVQDPAPFEEWPEAFLAKIGTDSRVVRFTFFFN
jgi:outer membrane biosynthesis protein TonB